MAVKIRLRRTGCNKCASFRIVATDSRAARDGRFIENLGHYDPKRAGENFVIDMDRVAYWQSQGAQLSETVASMVRKIKRTQAAEAAT
ncbi:MAG: 30S ribosomal protein S16 [Kiritimatiellia bacterium]|jgi:small subunit ribosomal protein S16